MIAAARGSADRFATSLAAGMPFFDDRGFYKRAQITANDLVLAGVADFSDVDRLTVFADNLAPARVADGRRPRVRAGAGGARSTPAVRCRPAAQMEREIRACTVHACEALARTPRAWRRARSTTGSGTAGRAALQRASSHLTRTVFY